MFITIYEDNIDYRKIESVCKCLENDGVCIAPTDTLYAFVCAIDRPKAAHRLANLKNKKLEKSNFSIICDSLSMASNYVKQISDKQFAFIKSLQTGGFTFVLKASHFTPKIFQNKKRTIGIRITQNKVLLEILNRLKKPLLVSSLPREDVEQEEYTDSELIYEKFSQKVDIVIDTGKITGKPSTVLDMSEGDEYEVIRQGLGVIDD